MMGDWEDDEEIKRLREYLMIPSVHPDPDYGPCVSFLQQQAEELELEAAVHELVANKPIVVISWTGTEPDLDAILLNSHMDVVPVYEEQWTHPPFAAEISEGWIYARGIQDMKAVGMIHLEAVRRLKMAGVRLKRTVHVSFVPDEEIGGEAGMQTFADTETFKAMNVGFEMDESAPHHLPDHVYAFYGERTVRSIKVTSRGSPSHGSFLPEDTAAEKLHFVIGKFLEFREEEKKKLEGIPDPTERLGEVTTVNLTMLEGGQQVNVIPDSLSASFDVRVTPYLPCDDFEEMVKSWCNEAGEGVTFEYIQKGEEIRSTEMDDIPFFDALKKVMDDRGIKINPVICAGSTDARWVRKKGIPALNLTPIVNSPLLLHAHDERLHVEEYKKGIDLMENILEAIANV